VEGRVPVADTQLAPAPGAPASVPPLLEGRALRRVYSMGDSTVEALRGVDFRIDLRENVAIIGPSGSGKSTLLHILGLLDRPSSGQYLFAGVDTDTLDDDRLATLRNRGIGFIFQSFNLVSGESALENVASPLVYAGVKRKERIERATEALTRVGLGDRLGHDPSQLSGGQRQRVAIARALVTNPAVILADEPTGNLDSTSSRDIFDLLGRLHAEGLTLVTITHDPRIAARADRVLRVEDGLIVDSGHENELGDLAFAPPPMTDALRATEPVEVAATEVDDAPAAAPPAAGATADAPPSVTDGDEGRAGLEAEA
jgi:putative ABC transport system ATP-binding protein